MSSRNWKTATTDVHVPFTSPLNRALSLTSKWERSFCQEWQNRDFMHNCCARSCRNTSIQVGFFLFFTLVCHCVGSWISFSFFFFLLLTFWVQFISKSSAGGHTKGFQWRLGSRTGPTTTLKYFFSPFLYIHYFPTRFYCLKYLQVCVFFVRMIKKEKKQTKKKHYKIVQEVCAIKICS